MTNHKSHNWIFLFFFILPFYLTNSVFAQPQDTRIQNIEIPSSFNPVGSGARALGMGGAFIAVADDATAASWNPGGLIQLGSSEISIVGDFFRRTEDNTFRTHPEASGEHRVTGEDLNYFSVSYPFTLFNRNMIVSLNYQHLFDFTSEIVFPFIQKSDALSLLRNVNYEQSGSLSAVGLAYGIQITPKFSLGLTLNLWKDWFGGSEWEDTTYEKGTGINKVKNAILTYESRQWNRYGFSGINVNMGFLWNISSKFTIGAVLKTPFTADVKHEFTLNEQIHYPEYPGDDENRFEDLCEDEKLDMPMSCGVGITYRHSDHLTVSADLYRTEWQNFILEDAKGNKTNPVSGLTEDEADIDPTHQIRIGAEYLFFDPSGSGYVIPLRGGIFYDPAPAEGSPDDFYGFTMGTGIAKGNFIFDIAYQFRFGRDVREFMLQHLDFSEHVNEHTVYSSIIIHF